jgi:hypothetical protein
MEFAATQFTVSKCWRRSADPRKSLAEALEIGEWHYERGDGFVGQDVRGTAGF